MIWLRHLGRTPPAKSARQKQMLLLMCQRQQHNGFIGLCKFVKMFVHSPKSQYAALLALAILWLGLAAGYGQGTIVYRHLSNPYPTPSIPQQWDDSGYPIFGPVGGGLAVDFNQDGQPDVGFNDDGTGFHIYGFGSTRVLTYPPAGLDINSFLPVLPAGTTISPTDC